MNVWSVDSFIDSYPCLFYNDKDEMMVKVVTGIRVMVRMVVYWSTLQEKYIYFHVLKKSI